MHDLDPTLIGARIRQLRGAATQGDFALLLGVGRVSITRYETGERTPDAEFLVKLNRARGVDPLWLLTGEGNSAEQAVLSATEQLLLRHYRSLSEAQREAVEKMAAALAGAGGYGGPHKATVHQTFHGQVGSVQSVHEGTLKVKHVQRVKKPRQG